MSPLALTLALALTAGVATTAPSPQDETTIYTRTRKDQTSAWFVRRPDGTVKKLRGPNTALALVAEVRRSPSGAWLAVVSVGEGHPILDVFDAQAVLRGEAPDPLVTVNPYPGTISIAGWSDDGALLVESDAELTLEPRDSGRTIMDDVEEFAIDLPSGAVSRREKKESHG